MEATAARLSVARFTVVSGWSAAMLHNLPCPAARLGLVTLTAECGARIRRPDLHVAVAPLPTAHVQDRFGVPTTTAARCAVDVARQSGADDFASVVCLLDAALHDGKASRVELQRMLDGMRRWPGSGVAVRTRIRRREGRDSAGVAVTGVHRRGRAAGAGYPGRDM